MTTTIELGPAEIETLREQLTAAGFEFRELQHAHYQARGPGVVVNAFRSGKVVFQGKGAAALLASLDLAAPAPPGLHETVVGSDESGKGDYFGPLVVAAVAVAPDQLGDVRATGVRDCKRMSDSSILRAAAAVRDLCPHAVRALGPPAYNDRHAATGNVSIVLAELHADAIAETVAQAPRCGRVVIDQFTSPRRLEKALDERGVELPLEIRHRAEDNPAVAAASVLARAEFLIGLRELGHEYGLELPKGAGRPVEKAAREIFEEYGIETLRALAKTHFKTTRRVTEELF